MTFRKMKKLLFLATFTLLPLVGLVSGQGPVGDTFKFYAYGNGIPGLRLFYAKGGAALLTDNETARLNQSLVPVTLTLTRRQHAQPPGQKGGYSFTATPDLSAINASIAASEMPINATFFVGNRPSPPLNLASHEVGFFPGAEDPVAIIPPGLKLGGFFFGDRTLMVAEETDLTSGVILPSLFCAFPSKEDPKIWMMQWNITNDVPERANGLPVTLKTYKWRDGSPPSFGFGTKCMTRL